MATYKITPPTVTDGLVLNLDAANPRSMPGLPATNLVKYSEEFTQTSQWSLTEITITPDTVETTAPDGTYTADILYDTTATNRHRLLTTGIALTAGYYTFSVYAKKRDHDWIQMVQSNINWDIDLWANFNLATGTIGNTGTGTVASITSVGNGWYRLTVQARLLTSLTTFPNLVLTINNTDATRYPSYTGTGAGCFYIWGAQLTPWALPIPYVKTTTAQIIGGQGSWTDISGNNGSGSFSNVAFDSNKKCLLFTSSSQSSCTLNNSSLLNFNTGSFSIETVVQLTATASGTVNSLYVKRAVTGGIGGSKGYGYRVLNSTTTNASLLISVDNGTGANNGDYTILGGASTTFPYYNIIHSVLIFDVSTLKLKEYRNGKLTSTTNTGVMTGSFYNNNTNLILGKRDGNSLDAEYYTFKAYNKALSEAEVLQNYNATKIRFNLK